jgi:hypothetical protein
LLKFAYQDFLDDRRFKNTTKTNIKNYEMTLGKFVDYCIENEVVNAEDITYSHVRQYLLKCQEKGDKAGTINTKLLRIRAFLNYLVGIILRLLAKYFEFIKMIVIHYDYSALVGATELGKDVVEDMIYTKFPERILYGLLRGYGKNIDIEAEVLIEKANEYENLNLFQLRDKHEHDVKLNLDDLVKDLLNIQALYRGENYVINNCRLVPKGEEIGVEMADMLLGIVRKD